MSIENQDILGGIHLKDRFLQIRTVFACFSLESLKSIALGFKPELRSIGFKLSITSDIAFQKKKEKKKEELIYNSFFLSLGLCFSRKKTLVDAVKKHLEK